MNIITLTMGDWSHDGHNMTTTVTIRSNLDRSSLEAAYEAGVEKTDVDLTEDIARDYEDGRFPDEDVEALMKFGFKPEEFLEKYDEDDDDWTISPDGFWLVWLFIAKVGDPSLEFEEAARDTSNINIGGYGMFSH